MPLPLRRIAALTMLLACSLMLPRALAAQPEGHTGWPGDWQTFWSSGEAFLILQQRGDAVSGTYQPGGGTVAGVTRDGVLRGTWSEGGESGDFIFVLSADGQSFAGRFGSGDWWNGHRAAIAQQQRPAWFSGATPQATLRSILTAGNDAIYHGREGQVRWIEPLLTYDSPDGDSSDRERRRRALWHILDISTFRLWDAPVPPAGAEPGETLAFEISPAGTSAGHSLRFRLGADGLWQLVVPPAVILQADLERLIDARGHDTLEALERARAGSPRMVMMDFLLGANDWVGAGDARALRALNLDHVPRQLRRIEGALMADYLRQSIDRIGFVYWQEIPDDPNRPLPYVYYRHPVGDITIAPTDILDDEGRTVERRWRFSRETMAELPDIYAALEKMPLAPGLTTQPPLSQFFATRQAVLARAGWLQAEAWGLETWQWMGVLAYLGVMTLVLMTGSVVARRLAGRDSQRGRLVGQLAGPVGLMAVALLFLDASERLGLTLRAFGVMSGLSAMLLILAGAALTYRIVSLIFDALMTKATQTLAYTDEIVLSLAQGLMKLLIVVGAVIGCADVAGLPYEGVLTGLGIGGVALAFAARETVSNIIGGAILLSDRPFRKGDLVEAADSLAVIETVGLRSTRLRKLDDTLMIVPNAQLSDQVISNWGSRRRRRVLMKIGLTYETPRAQLEQFVARLMEIYRDQPEAETDNVTIGITSLGPHSIDIELWGHFRVFSYEAQIAAQQALILDILSLAEELGINFAYPTQTVHLAADNGSGPTTA
ncbi:mechanosensitive ion channel family protein [Mameliella sp.]|uniref:mechanosensitive ion channel family protein n=1 Tax=Mameliella sp. TaxID=1924940 RepID=UPI003B50FE2B